MVLVFFVGFGACVDFGDCVDFGAWFSFLSFSFLRVFFFCVFSFFFSALRVLFPPLSFHPLSFSFQAQAFFLFVDCVSMVGLEDLVDFVFVFPARPNLLGRLSVFFPSPPSLPPSPKATNGLMSCERSSEMVFLKCPSRKRLTLSRDNRLLSTLLYRIRFEKVPGFETKSSV